MRQEWIQSVISPLNLSSTEYCKLDDTFCCHSPSIKLSDHKSKAFFSFKTLFQTSFYCGCHVVRLFVLYMIKNFILVFVSDIDLANYLQFLHLCLFVTTLYSHRIELAQANESILKKECVQIALTAKTHTATADAKEVAFAVPWSGCYPCLYKWHLKDLQVWSDAKFRSSCSEST